MKTKEKNKTGKENFKREKKKKIKNVREKWWSIMKGKEKIKQGKQEVRKNRKCSKRQQKTLVDVSHKQVVNLSQR